MAARRGEVMDEDSPEVQRLRAAHLAAVENLVQAVHQEQQRARDGGQALERVPMDLLAAVGGGDFDGDDTDSGDEAP